jgi:HlyD family secretion protein
MSGVLQLLPVEVGAQVGPGANLARVANPSRLRAQVRVPETQAKDLRVGQRATIDTRAGVIAGSVSRIDPSVQKGTVLVDVSLQGELPPAARPDLTIEGTIEIERLRDVLFVGRPAFGNENSEVQMFKLDADGESANRISVRLGRTSTNTVEILGGLAAGDRVILSDMAQWAQSERVRID